MQSTSLPVPPASGVTTAPILLDQLKTLVQSSTYLATAQTRRPALLRPLAVPWLRLIYTPANPALAAQIASQLNRRLGIYIDRRTIVRWYFDDGGFALARAVKPPPKRKPKCDKSISPPLPPQQHLAHLRTLLNGPTYARLSITGQKAALRHHLQPYLTQVYARGDVSAADIAASLSELLPIKVTRSRVIGWHHRWKKCFKLLPTGTHVGQKKATRKPRGTRAPRPAVAPSLVPRSRVKVGITTPPDAPETVAAAQAPDNHCEWELVEGWPAMVCKAVRMSEPRGNRYCPHHHGVKHRKVAHTGAPVPQGQRRIPVSSGRAIRPLGITNVTRGR